jgi:hypothetical protein
MTPRAWREQIETETDRCAYIPTPEDIQRMAAEIRAGWSEATRVQRLNQNLRATPVWLHTHGDLF